VRCRPILSVISRTGSSELWIVRQGDLRLALPFVTGPRSATYDYEPAPHGLPGFAAPGEKIYPCLIPFLELEDGRTIAAADGADEIHPSSDGLKVSATWNRWVVVGSKAGETIDPGLKTEVTWSLEQGKNLYRTESITASKPIEIRRIWMAVPTHADQSKTLLVDGKRDDQLISNEATLGVRVLRSDWPVQGSAFATGDDPLGRGDRGAIPIHVIIETPQKLSFKAGSTQSWEIELTDNPAVHF
jgi:hypothetical protein